MKSLPLVIGCLLFCQCGANLPGRADGIDPNPFALLEKQATAENHDASRLRVPLLESPAFEQRWGKPRLLVGPNGGYALRYQNPANRNTHLTVFGSSQKFATAGDIPPPYTNLGFNQQKLTYEPVVVSQKWNNISIAGRSVRYCISEGSSEDQSVQYSTETFRLTAPDGRTASYRIRVASAGRKAAESIKPMLESVKFR